ncbi:MAG: type II toxin-antitoxin system RelE/ParE family toxin [Rhodocyclales bacterium]|nr:type II toxin-antitoxin system RelE/ParE family toxin [Rhodocyclales bacterium]
MRWRWRIANASWISSPATNPWRRSRLTRIFETHADRIEANPYLYRPGRVPDTREAVVHPNYVMVYRIESETITILRVLHAAQRWPSAE